MFSVECSYMEPAKSYVTYNFHHYFHNFEILSLTTRLLKLSVYKIDRNNDVQVPCGYIRLESTINL